VVADSQQIGNEFASVEALWSQFETVMGRENEDGLRGESGEGEEGEDRGQDGGDGQDGEK
jgi:DASH complex subunit DAD1